MLPMRKSKIIWRLVILYISICVIPVALSGYFYHVHYTRDIREKAGDDALKVLSMLSDRQVDILQNIEYVSGKLSLSDAVQSLLQQPDLSEYRQHELVREVNRLVLEETIISPLIKNVILTNAEGEIVYSMGYDIIRASDVRRLGEQAQQVAPLEYITAYQSPYTQKVDMVQVRVVRQNDTSRAQLGHLFITMDEETFAEETYAEIYPKEQGTVFVLGDDGTVISSIDEMIPAGFPLEQPDLLSRIEAQHANTQYHMDVDWGDESYLLSFDYNSKAHWYTIVLIRDNYLNSETNRIGKWIFWFSFVCIVLGLFCLAVISGSIVRPITRLVEYCRAVTLSGTNSQIHDQGKDEISFLINEVSGMVERLDAYHEQERLNNLERRNLELQMLQAQINPHFLFNTLNSIKWIAVMSRVPAVADGLSALASLLRNSIVNKDEFIRVEEEIENLKNYAFIQSLRYGDKFAVSFSVGEDCLNRKIPKFLLQPVVENAVIHGVEKVIHCVQITIKVEDVSGGIMITIQDNGAGFDVGILEQNNTSSKRFSGIGMKNVEQRIKLVYGAEAWMKVCSELQAGTTVTMYLPEAE